MCIFFIPWNNAMHFFLIGYDLDLKKSVMLKRIKIKQYILLLYRKYSTDVTHIAMRTPKRAANMTQAFLSFLWSFCIAICTVVSFIYIVVSSKYTVVFWGEVVVLVSFRTFSSDIWLVVFVGFEVIELLS